MRGVTLTLFAASATAAVAAPVVTASQTASRIIDRTVVCKMPGEGFPDSTRFMTVAVGSRPPLISVSNGPSLEVRALVATRAIGRKRTGSMALNRAECAPSDRRLRLSARGLREAARRSFSCGLASNVVIRVRAVFRRPTGFTADSLTPSLQRARGRISSGYLAIASLGGKPLAFAAVNDETGRARLFVARRVCAAAR